MLHHKMCALQNNMTLKHHMSLNSKPLGNDLMVPITQHITESKFNHMNIDGNYLRIKCMVNTVSAIRELNTSEEILFGNIMRHNFIKWYNIINASLHRDFNLIVLEQVTQFIQKWNDALGGIQKQLEHIQNYETVAYISIAPKY